MPPLHRQVSEYEMHEAAEDMLEKSGVPELEARVLGFLTGNAASIKLTAILDDLTRLLHLVRPLLRSGLQGLRLTHSDLG